MSDSSSEDNDVEQEEIQATEENEKTFEQLVRNFWNPELRSKNE